MAILNETFDMAQADPADRFAFRGTPRRVLFNPGDRLMRFTSLPQGRFAGNQIFGSPWWQPQQTFNAIVRTANRTGASLLETARSGLAVTEEWNPTMEWLVTVELRSAAYGWMGPTRHQPLHAGDRSVLLPGDLTQVYMPGLANSSGATSSDHAVILHWGSMLEI